MSSSSPPSAHARRVEPDPVTPFSGQSPTFLDAETWGSGAENAAESLTKGDRVLITGRIRTDVYTPDSGPNAGNEQRRPRIVVDELAVSLRHAIARPTKPIHGTYGGPSEVPSPSQEASVEAPF